RRRRAADTRSCRTEDASTRQPPCCCGATHPLPDTEPFRMRAKSPSQVAGSMSRIGDFAWPAKFGKRLKRLRGARHEKLRRLTTPCHGGKRQCQRDPAM